MIICSARGHITDTGSAPWAGYSSPIGRPSACSGRLRQEWARRWGTDGLHRTARALPARRAGPGAARRALQGPLPRSRRLGPWRDVRSAGRRRAAPNRDRGVDGVRDVARPAPGRDHARRRHGTAVQIRGVVTLDNEPKTTRSRRTIPVARSGWPGSSSISTSASASGPTTWCSPPPPADRSSGPSPRRCCGPPSSAPASTTSRSTGSATVSWPSSWAAGCNVREVSEWAGHNSVAFTLTRYGGLFEDGSDAAVDRLDALLAPPRSGPPAASAQALRGRTSSRGTQCCQLTAGAIQECTASHRETWRT